MARVTVQNIADELGISKFAVSRALAGKTGVSEETRQLIVEKAQSMGYVARAQTAPFQGGIEVIFHDPEVAHRELWVDVQSGVQEEGARLGFSTAVRWTTDITLPARLKPQTTGFILVGPQDEDMIEAARATGLPCVRIGPQPAWLDPMDQVGVADHEATGVIADHLLDLGHRRFVYAHGAPGYPGRSERLRSFASAIGRTGDTALRELDFPADDQPGNFRASLDAMLADGFEPTAFFCGNDWVGVTVITELLRLGLRVPEDVSVVGFADYPIASFVSPKLTTVHSPHREMGVAAVQIIHSRTGRGGPRSALPPQRLNLVGALIVRESSGPAATRSWQSALRL